MGLGLNKDEQELLGKIAKEVWKSTSKSTLNGIKAAGNQFSEDTREFLDGSASEFLLGDGYDKPTDGKNGKTYREINEDNKNKFIEDQKQLEDDSPYKFVYNGVKDKVYKELNELALLQVAHSLPQLAKSGSAIGKEAYAFGKEGFAMGKATFSKLGEGLEAFGANSKKYAGKISQETEELRDALMNGFGKEKNKFGGACFTEDTLVLTKDGHRPIKDIKIGDEVCSFNDTTYSKGLKKVTRLFINKTNKIIHVTINGDVIKATQTHPFWVIGKGWTIANELNVDDNLILYSGRVTKVVKLREEILEEYIDVYNLEVEEWHTYYVSNKDVLVHNSCSDWVPPKDKWAPAGSDWMTWISKNKYSFERGETRDMIKKMLVKDRGGNIIGEIHDGQPVKYGSHDGEMFQIHFEYYKPGTTKCDDSLHLYFEDLN